MIKNNQPLSMAEVSAYLQKDKEADALKFIKKFTKMPAKDAKKLRKNLEAHDLMKLKPEHITKIIDLMPENAEELNKIFVDVGLDENETNKILKTIKELK